MPAGGMCEVWGSVAHVLHSRLTDQLFGSPRRWSTRECGNAGCRLGWLDPQPLPDELHKLYVEYHTHVSLGDAPADSYRSNGIRRLVKRLLGAGLFWRRSAFRSEDLYLEGMPPGRLLEIGCGSGAFLAVMKAQGWEAVGLDFDAQAVAAARGARGVGRTRR